MIGSPVTSPHRQRRAAAGVAVELGQHHAGEADAVAERLRGGDGVLADHGVDDEQGLVGRARRRGCRRPARIISSSMPSRPAVSTMTTSNAWPWPRRSSRGDRDRVAVATGSPTPLARFAARTPCTPARSPTICS